MFLMGGDTLMHTMLDLSKASDPDCIPVVVLKNCQPELSYILAELFNKCLKDSFFPDCCKVSSVVPVFTNVGERSTAKNYHHVILLSAVSKVFEKLVNNRIADHLENRDFIVISSMVLALLDQLLIFSQLYLIDLLGLFRGLGLLELWLLVYPRLFTGVWHADLLHKLKSYEISGQIFDLISSFLSIRGFEWFGMESIYRNIQLMLEFLKALFLVLHFSYYILMTFLMMLYVILLSMLMILLYILSVTRQCDL